PGAEADEGEKASCEGVGEKGPCIPAGHKSAGAFVSGGDAVFFACAIEKGDQPVVEQVEKVAECGILVGYDKGGVVIGHDTAGAGQAHEIEQHLGRGRVFWAAVVAGGSD